MPLLPLLPLLLVLPLPLPPPLPLPLDVSLVLPVLLPEVSLFMGEELHAASPTASKPARITLACCRFMMNSLLREMNYGVCVTMQRATEVRGARRGDVPIDGGRD